MLLKANNEEAMKLENTGEAVRTGNSKSNKDSKQANNLRIASEEQYLYTDDFGNEFDFYEIRHLLDL